MHEKICPTCLSYMNDDSLRGWMRCPSCAFMKKKATSMITSEEVLMGRATFDDLSDELKSNLNELLTALNLFRKEYGKPMYVTSGYRPASINSATPGASKKSAHMTLQACDFNDASGDIFEFIKNDPSVLERCGLYMENPGWTPTWIHLQVRSASKRIFLPYADGREATAPNRII